MLGNLGSESSVGLRSSENENNNPLANAECLSMQMDHWHYWGRFNIWGIRVIYLNWLQLSSFQTQMLFWGICEELVPACLAQR